MLFNAINWHGNFGDYFKTHLYRCVDPAPIPFIHFHYRFPCENYGIIIIFWASLG